MRLGLGCMRLVEDPIAGRDAIRAALDAGITVFDTAPTYGPSQTLLGEVLREHGLGPHTRVISKCGMRRDGDAWIPDGRASVIEGDARANAGALGRPVDLLLLHAPDPRTAIATSVRAMIRAKENGLARAIGVSNVSRRELDEIAALAPMEGVEIALGAHDDAAARGGVIGWCTSRTIEVFGHAPLGGPRRASKLAHDGALRAIAERFGITNAELVLAYLLALSPALVPLVGVKRRAHVESMVRAEAVTLDDEALALLDARFRGLSVLRRPIATPVDARAEVVLMMGVAGAGKSRAVEAYVTRGYTRLNRDTLGGTLKGIVQRLDALLAGGAERVVLDNTYVTRASRSDVVRAAHARGASVRCVFFDTPLADAEINITTRMLDKYDALLGSIELKTKARKDPNLMPPGPLFRMAKDLERPEPDEGFSAIEIVPFVREHPAGAVHSGAAIALELVARPDLTPNEGARELVLRGGGPVLVFGWRPGVDPDRVRALETELGAHVALCTHPAGPPVCWCRPPLPGLFVAFARTHNVDPRKCIMLGASPAHRTMARALGLAYDEPAR